MQIPLQGLASNSFEYTPRGGNSGSHIITYLVFRLFFFFGKFLFVYLVFIWLRQVLVAACGTLATQPGIEPRAPVPGAWSLSHWTTREAPNFSFLGNLPSIFHRGCTHFAFLLTVHRVSIFPQDYVFETWQLIGASLDTLFYQKFLQIFKFSLDQEECLQTKVLRILFILFRSYSFSAQSYSFLSPTSQ